MKQIYYGYSYRHSVEEMAKTRRCRELVEKDNLSDTEKRALQAKMMSTLNTMRKTA